MKCPNCNETEHEPGAYYCHVCGKVIDPEGFKWSQELQEYDKYFQESWERFKMEQQRKAEAKPANPWWVKMLRYVLLVAFILFGVYISIAESLIETPWGGVTIVFVNAFAFFMTLFLCIMANREDGNSDKKGVWRLYYDWLHFFFAAIALVLGYLIVSNIQSLLTILLEMGVTGLLLIADFGTLEDLIDVL